MTGYGPDLPASITWVYPESQYVSYLIEGGLPVLALFGALGWAMLRRTRDATRSEDPFEQAVGRAVFLAVAGRQDQVHGQAGPQSRQCCIVIDACLTAG